MELIELSQQIQDKIRTLELMRAELKNRATEKARSKASYEREVAITIVKLRNGVKMNIGGQEIENPPASVTEKIARGICWEECLAMDEADGLYKSLIVNLQVVQAELNGLQSINRFLKEN